MGKGHFSNSWCRNICQLGLQMLVLSTVLLGCHSNSANNWNQISATEHLALVAVEEITGNIWVAEPYGDYIASLQVDDTPNSDLSAKVLVPPPEGINDLCVVGNVWVVLMDDTLAAYNEATNVWITNLELNSPSRIKHCYRSPDGVLFLLGDTWFGKYEMNSWEITNVPNVKELLSIAWGQNGKIWLLAKDGEILTENERGDWESFGKVNAKGFFRLLFIIDDKLWITADNQLWVWSISNRAAGPSIALELSRAESVYAIDKDNTDLIWIATSEGIWVLDSAPRRMDSPDVTSIYSATFDHLRGRLYLTTTKGVYYRQIGSAP